MKILVKLITEDGPPHNSHGYNDITYATFDFPDDELAHELPEFHKSSKWPAISASGASEGITSKGDSRLFDAYITSGNLDAFHRNSSIDRLYCE